MLLDFQSQLGIKQLKVSGCLTVRLSFNQGVCISQKMGCGWLGHMGHPGTPLLANPLPFTPYKVRMRFLTFSLVTTPMFPVSWSLFSQPAPFDKACHSAFQCSDKTNIPKSWANILLDSFNFACFLCLSIIKPKLSSCCLGRNEISQQQQTTMSVYLRLLMTHL